MKKILGVIVLGLLLSGNAYANAVLTQQDIEKDERYMNEWYGNFTNKYSKKKCALAQVYDDRITIWGAACRKTQEKADKVAIKVCEKKSKKSRCVVTKNASRVVNSVPKKIYITSNTNSSNSVGTDIEFTTSIGKHKNTCKELGFTPGTEKFGDCALKLIELEVAQQGNNKAAQQIQIVQQEAPYDGWMGELGLSILRGDFSRKTQQPAYRFPVQQKSVCRFQNNGFAQPTLNCTTR